MKQLRPPTISPEKMMLSKGEVNDINNGVQDVPPWERPLARSLQEGRRIAKKVITDKRDQRKGPKLTMIREAPKPQEGVESNKSKNTVDDCSDDSEEPFVPYGPFPIPSKAAAAVASLQEKVNIRQRACVNTNTGRPKSSIDTPKSPTSHHRLMSSPNAPHGHTSRKMETSTPNSVEDFERELLHAISLHSDVNKPSTHHIPRRFLKTLDALLKNAKRCQSFPKNPDHFLHDIEAMIRGEREERKKDNSRLEGAAGASSSHLQKKTDTGRESAYQQIDASLDRMSIRHRRLSGAMGIANQKVLRRYKDKSDALKGKDASKVPSLVQFPIPTIVHNRVRTLILTCDSSRNIFGRSM